MDDKRKVSKWREARGLAAWGIAPPVHNAEKLEQIKASTAELKRCHEKQVELLGELYRALMVKHVAGIDHSNFTMHLVGHPDKFFQAYYSLRCKDTEEELAIVPLSNLPTDAMPPEWTDRKAVRDMTGGVRTPFYLSGLRKRDEALAKKEAQDEQP